MRYRAPSERGILPSEHAACILSEMRADLIRIVNEAMADSNTPSVVVDAILDEVSRRAREERGAFDRSREVDSSGE